MGAMCGKEMPVVETANPPGAPSATSSTTEVGQIDLDVSGSQGMETEGFRAWSEMENGTERDFLVEEAGDDAAMTCRGYGCSCNIMCIRSGIS